LRLRLSMPWQAAAADSPRSSLITLTPESSSHSVALRRVSSDRDASSESAELAGMQFSVPAAGTGSLATYGGMAWLMETCHPPSAGTLEQAITQTGWSAPATAVGLANGASSGLHQGSGNLGSNENTSWSWLLGPAHVASCTSSKPMPVPSAVEGRGSGGSVSAPTGILSRASSGCSTRSVPGSAPKTVRFSDLQDLASPVAGDS